MEANYENRIYYFNISEQTEEMVRISMYATPYTFVKKGERWLNHQSNRMEMKSGLIVAVLLAAGEV